MNKIFLYFYCNANDTEGLGHFMRCLNLALLIRNRYTHIFFVGNLNEFARKMLHKNKINCICEDIDYFNKSSLKINLLVLDSYHIRGRILKNLTDTYKVLVFDDFNDRNLYNAAAVLNFTINANAYDYRKIPCKFLGVSFFPYSKKLQEIRNKNLKKPKSISRKNQFVFMTFSGTNIDDVLVQSVVRIVDDFFDDSHICLLHKKHLMIDKTKNRYTQVFYTPNISSFYNKACLVITGGGLTKYESAFCGIPNFTISVNQEQHKETLDFEKYNLTRSLGNFYNFDPKSIGRNLIKFFDDSFWIDKFYEASRAVFKKNILKDSIYRLAKYG